MTHTVRRMRKSRVLAAATSLLLMAGLASVAPAHAADESAWACTSAAGQRETDRYSFSLMQSPSLTVHKHETIRVNFEPSAASQADTVALTVGYSDGKSVDTIVAASIGAGTVAYTMPANRTINALTVVASHGGHSDETTRIDFDLKCGRICDSPAPAGFNVIVGTEGSETLTGTSGADFIVARGGNDSINGRGGDDIICAGSGADKVVGGSGADLIFGGAGQDDLYGSNGFDTGVDPAADTYRASIESKFQ